MNTFQYHGQRDDLRADLQVEMVPYFLRIIPLDEIEPRMWNMCIYIYIYKDKRIRLQAGRWN